MSILFANGGAPPQPSVFLNVKPCEPASDENTRSGLQQSDLERANHVFKATSRFLICAWPSFVGVFDTNTVARPEGFPPSVLLD